MISKVLHSSGNNDVYWIPASLDLAVDEVLVKTAYTSICRSDVDMYKGNWGPLPPGMFGHEAIGTVIQTPIGHEHMIGKYVSTAGDGAFGPYHKCKISRLVEIPELSPCYILEPVGCAVNICNQIKTDKLLIIGSGVMASMLCIAYLTSKLSNRLVLVTRHPESINVPIMLRNRIKIIPEVSDQSFMTDELTIVNFKNDVETFNKILQLSKDNQYILQCAELKDNISINFSSMLWKNQTLGFPSPRNSNFKLCMMDGLNLVYLYKDTFSAFFLQGYAEDLYDLAFKNAETAYNKRIFIKWI